MFQGPVFPLTIFVIVGLGCLLLGLVIYAAVRLALLHSQKSNDRQAVQAKPRVGSVQPAARDAEGGANIP